MVPIIRTCSLWAALLVAAPVSAQIDPTIYVRARAAEAAGLPELASAGYAIVLRSAPKDDHIAARAYRQALAAGDLVLARHAASVMLAAGTAPPDTAMLALATALKAGDWAGVDEALVRIGDGPLDFLTPILRAWVALDRRQDPLPEIQNARRDRLAARYATGHRAMLLVASGRGDDGMIAYSAIVDPAMRNGALKMDLAALLAAREQRKLAISLIGEDQFKRNRAYLQKAGQGGASFGVARLLIDMAEDIAPRRISALSILLTRSALLLDPRADRARLLLAEALATTGAQSTAIAELNVVKRDSPYFANAQLARVGVLDRDGRAADALLLAKSLSEKGGVAEASTYGELLFSEARFAEAAAAYRLAITRSGEMPRWDLYLAEGKALDRAGQWDAALPVLREAMARAPTETAALEYLGYGLIQRRDSLDEAQAMLEKAAELKPSEPSISAALGWAYFLRGDTARALPLLEKAARADPAGERANEHLGDAYWTLGRQYEARYAWLAAKIYAGPESSKRLQGKIDNGLK